MFEFVDRDLKKFLEAQEGMLPQSEVKVLCLRSSLIGR